MDENTILDDISKFHQSLYDYVKTIQSDIPTLEVMGFGSSINRPELPIIGMRVNLREIEVDRSRPTPLAGKPVTVPSEQKNNYEYKDELYENIPDGYTLRHPMPIILHYELTTWCYKTLTQLSLDHAIFKRFPERGVLYLPIDNVEYQFPITLAGIENLDDLKRNFRERVYRYDIEVWIESSLSDIESKIITTSNIEVFEGSEITDTDIKLMEINTQAEIP